MGDPTISATYEGFYDFGNYNTERYTLTVYSDHTCLLEVRSSGGYEGRGWKTDLRGVIQGGNFRPNEGEKDGYNLKVDGGGQITVVSFGPTTQREVTHLTQLTKEKGASEVKLNGLSRSA